MSEFDESINTLFKDLCAYKPQPIELREYLRENMSCREFKERGVLSRKHKPVTEAFWTYRGYIATYGANGNVLSIAKPRSILAGFSFNSQQPADYELLALPGSYVLGISAAHMNVIYEHFPGTAELARLIIADTADKEQARMISLNLKADLAITNFYNEYPGFLGTGLMSDRDIASFLLIAESTFRNTRSQLNVEEKLIINPAILF